MQIGAGGACGYLRKDTPESICYNEHVPARKVAYANADALRDGQEKNEKAGFYKRLFGKYRYKKTKGELEGPVDAGLLNRSIGAIAPRAGAPAAAFCYIRQNRICGFCLSEVST